MLLIRAMVSNNKGSCGVGGLGIRWETYAMGSACHSSYREAVTSAAGDGGNSAVCEPT